MDAATVRTALKPLLGIDGNDTSRDAELDGYVTMAKAVVEAYLGDPLDQGEHVDTFYNPEGYVALSAWPVASVTSVVVDGVTLDASRYRLRAFGGLEPVDQWGNTTEWRGVTQWYGNQVTVTYQAGYQNSPRWLVDALAEVAARASTRVGSGGDPTGTGQVKRESVPGVWTVEYETGRAADGDHGLIPAHVRVVLEMHRVPSHA